MTDLIPFPEASTRAEARDNAIACARIAEDASGAHNSNSYPDRMISLALVWSRVAATFPEDPVFAEATIEDYRPYPAAEETQAIQTPVIRRPGVVGASGVPWHTPTTITVDSAVWDVLRSLAIRAVAATSNRETTVDLGTGAGVSGLDLELIPTPGGSMVTAILAHTSERS